MVNFYKPVAGYACPIYSRTGRVTEGSEAPSRAPCRRFLAALSLPLCQVHSFGMVMLELLTGLAPATADPTRCPAIPMPLHKARCCHKSCGKAEWHRVPSGRCHFAALPPASSASKVPLESEFDQLRQHSPGSLERCLCNLDTNAASPALICQRCFEVTGRPHNRLGLRLAGQKSWPKTWLSWRCAQCIPRRRPLSRSCPLQPVSRFNLFQMQSGEHFGIPRLFSILRATKPALLE